MKCLFTFPLKKDDHNCSIYIDTIAFKNEGNNHQEPNDTSHSKVNKQFSLIAVI